MFSSENHVEIRDFSICMFDNFVLQKLYCVMKEIIEDAYDFELVDDNPMNLKYEFISIGEKPILKRVAFSNYNSFGLNNIYNLGFGNLIVLENGEESVLDLSRDNNKKDKRKVLNTVFTCVLDFLIQNPQTVVTFYGNTSAKHRLYRMEITAKFSVISEYFVVGAGVITNLKVEESLNEGKYPISKIKVEDIVIVDYSPNDNIFYHFFTFQLKKDK